MKDKNGFSIVELIIVLVVVMILSATSLVLINFYKGMKLQGAAEQVAEFVRYAQSQAMSETVWHGVSFEVDPTDKVSVYKTNGTIDTLESDPRNLANTMVMNTSSEYSVVIVSLTLEGTGHHIEFNGLGVPYSDYSGGPLTREADILLGTGTSRKTIAVTPNTGQVTIK